KIFVKGPTPDAQGRPALRAGLAPHWKSSLELCRNKLLLRRVGGEKLLVLARLPGVSEAEADQHCHDAGEAECCDRTPEGDLGDQAEAVGLEQQAPKRGALEDRLHLGLG